MSDADKLVEELIAQDKKQVWDKDTTLFKQAAEMIQEQQLTISDNNKFLSGQIERVAKVNWNLKIKNNFKSAVIVLFAIVILFF